MDSLLDKPEPVDSVGSPSIDASSSSAAGLALAGSLALAACGGGGGGSSGSGSGSSGSGSSSSGSSSAGGSTGTTTGTPPTQAEAARFLHQASLAATDSDIASVQSLGYSAWLDQQLAAQPSTTNYNWLNNAGFGVIADQWLGPGTDSMAWRALIAETNPVVQRIAFMWSEIMVVSSISLQYAWVQYAMAAYLDVLTANGTGSFRALLKAVTLNPAMGEYLSLAYSQAANAATNVHPDENYAREVMQLMTIGLYQLNMDGSQVLSNGAPVPTYVQADVTGLAAALTGWGFAQAAYTASPAFTQLPMVQQAAYGYLHTSTDSTFLGVTIPGGTTGEQALEIVLDTLVNHANTPPFISKQIIQRLVTSNPSPAYVARVSAVFVNDGNGNRGNLTAVIKAVLLDSEARTAGAAGYGRPREPMLRLVQWARTFGATSASGTWTIGNTAAADVALAQSPLRSPSVFNFFSPGFTPPGSPIAAQGLVAPEFQLLGETSVAGYLNYLQGLVANGAGDVTTPYTKELALANDPTALLARLNLLLAANQLDPNALALITTTVASMPSATSANLLARVQAAVFLVMASPSYLVLK